VEDLIHPGSARAAVAVNRKFTFH